MIGPAIESLDRLIAQGHSGKFDFAFLDAIKAEYDAYYEKCLKLLRPGGIIALDNMLQSGAVVDIGTPKEATYEERCQIQAPIARVLSEKLKDDPRIYYSLLPIGDGLGLAFVK